jgi:hypothetical protein
MATVRAARSRARYESRPGRGVVVAASLAELCGPTEGVVELPIWLFWQPDRRFDLGEPGMLRWMYQTVLREAARAEDLGYLNGELLAAVWPELCLPPGVRQAWADQHPALQATPVPVT